VNRCLKCGMRLLDSQPRECWTCEEPPPLWFGILITLGIPVGLPLALWGASWLNL
jgi:hypothetical protein